MARHPVARRVQRQSTHGDDVFVERVLEGSVWIKENARTLVIALVALIVLTLGFVYYRSTSARLRDVAETELTTIRQTVLAGNAALAVRDLETFLDRFGGTKAAEEARLLLGRAYLDNGEPQKAIDLFQNEVGDLGTPMGVQAGMLLAGAYEMAAQPDQAIATYLRIGERARFDYQKQLALDNAARIRFERGDAAGAVELYDRILQIVPASSPDRQVYELRRAEAAARAQGGAPAPSGS